MEVLLDEVDVVEDAAAAIAELPVAAATCVKEDDGAVVDVLVEAVDDELKGTAGVGGASKRMYVPKLTMSELKSEIKLPLGGEITLTVVTTSSGSGLGAHCGVGKFRLSGKMSLVTPSSTL